MSVLFLLRHAKAAWARPGVQDFDRPLDATGIAEAKVVAAAFVKRYPAPDAVLCSTARRTRETWDIFSHVLGRMGEGVHFSTSLYSGDAATYADLIEETLRQAGSLLVVGHNPMTEDIAHRLARSGDQAALSRLASGFPTCGLAILALGEQDGDLRPRSASLEAFLTPPAL